MPRGSRSQPTESAIPDNARERILAAAKRCIDRHGIRKTTMDDIASEVGLSRPSVYRHFADRDDLLVELIMRRPKASKTSIASRTRGGPASPDAFTPTACKMRDIEDAVCAGFDAPRR